MEQDTSPRPSCLFQKQYPNGVELSPDVISLFDGLRAKRQAITFDETTLEDKPSDFHPADVKLQSFATRNIVLKGLKRENKRRNFIPLLSPRTNQLIKQKKKACGIMSAAMDTVTEQEMALALAKMGGMVRVFFFLFSDLMKGSPSPQFGPGSTGCASGVGSLED
jgi:IMP dehydrogenase/GMP reductase